MSTAGHGQSATVYLVDDDPSVQRALFRLLLTAGFSVTAFGTVDELMAAEVEGENACVVADIRMPGTNGLSLPHLLERRGAHLPVIYVTAQDTEEARAGARRAGAAGYFRKPVDAQALIDAIHWALSDQRGAR